MDITSINCGEAKKVVKLDSRIISFSYGVWGQEQDIMAIVLSDLPSYIQFYYLLGDKMGQVWFEVSVNNA